LFVVFIWTFIPFLLSAIILLTCMLITIVLILFLCITFVQVLTNM
jgi:hypothetical protein